MNKSEAKRVYKESKRPMGIYRIRNMENDHSYIGSSIDLQAGINRQKAELKFGSHRNSVLLDEWELFGESVFEFEILDELEFDEDSKSDPMEELRVLCEMWVQKLEKTGSVIAVL